MQQLESFPIDGGLLIAHVCDCHFLQGEPVDQSDPKHRSDLESCPDPSVVAERLAAVVAELNALQPRPRLVLFGGDLTERGRPLELEQFFQIAETLAIPYFVTLGNHDHCERSNWARTRPALVQALGRARTCRTRPEAVSDVGLYYTVQENGWRLAVVDSMFDVPLDGVQRDALARELSDRTVPTILSIHRPFVKVGNAMDRYRMLDPDLMRLIVESGCVKLILSGHTHKGRACRHANITHLVTPPICDGIDDTPGYRLICLDKDALALTVIRRLSARGESAPIRFESDEVQPCDDDPFL